MTNRAAFIALRFSSDTVYIYFYLEFLSAKLLTSPRCQVFNFSSKITQNTTSEQYEHFCRYKE